VRSKSVDLTTAKFLSVGLTLVTIFLTTSGVTDPVNTPKFFVAGGFAFALGALFFGFNFRENLSRFRWLIGLNLLFLLAALSATLNSSSPLSQNLFGVYGRNTGLLTYLFLSFALLGALQLRRVEHFQWIIYALFISGSLNVLYCGWVLVFGDFLSWNNPYGNILGLFGNPNFIGAFLGMFITGMAGYFFKSSLNLKSRVGLAAASLITFIEILESNAVQGIVVTFSGIALVLFFKIRSLYKGALPLFVYTTVIGVFGGLSVLGALQKGPFDFIYKRSVSLRGSYWDAGMEMGFSNLWTGVGMDAYGDWYRRVRSVEAATNMPGLNTVTNAAHNVWLDLFAYGGLPLLLAYLSVLSLGAFAIFKITRRNRDYDFVFVILTSVWACYHLQSIISINQVGLAIWGWVLTGALVVYEYLTRETHPDASERRKSRMDTRSNSQIVSPQLVAGVGFAIGLFVALPPLNSDMKWKSALDSGDALKVMETLESNLMVPANSNRFAEAAKLFAQSNLFDQARIAALKGIEFNEDSFDCWKILYFLSTSTPDEKELAVENMKRLDPLNPDVTIA
jgi:O-antigen ligase